MTKDTAKTRQETPSSSRTNLDRQYGNIGISAVAAALPYQGESKNPAYAPSESEQDERFVSEQDERFVAAA